MPRGTPFHSRTSALCESYSWRNWSGFLVASSYTLVPEMEYHAIRNAAALLDISPLFKYRISAPDALRLVDRVVTRNMRECRPQQIVYTTWCDERGKTVDDGTLWNLGDGTYRMTSAEPNLKWLQDAGYGMDVEVEDVSEDLAVVALQGPTSRAILHEPAAGAADKLRFYRFTEAKIGGIPATISRTGYTGDLGYEVWVDRDQAEDLWDTLVRSGRGHGITAAGMLALDIARIEAGFILAEVDYVPSRKAVIDAQRYSPFELSLDWTVAMDKGSFVGRRALQEELRRGVARRIVGVEVDWNAAARFFQEKDLPPEPPKVAWRSNIPLYHGALQVGRATSGCWSPLLKKYICIATVDSAYASTGQPLEIEVTVEGERKKAPATVVTRPFFDPERKKA